MLQKLKGKVIGLFVAAALTTASSQAIAQQQIFHAVVAQDGTGQYSTVQSAINAAPDNSESPWLIFVKNGSYNEQVIVPKSKRFIHLIGQDKEKTIIHHKLNVGGKPSGNEPSKQIRYWESSVHNPQAPTYKMKGSVVIIDAPDFYSENISYVNDFGKDSQSGPQALAMQTNADKISFNNCKFQSFQDTWMTTRNDNDRHYVKDCWIEGAVDYFSWKTVRFTMSAEVRSSSHPAIKTRATDMYSATVPSTGIKPQPKEETHSDARGTIIPKPSTSTRRCLFPSRRKAGMTWEPYPPYLQNTTAATNRVIS